MTLLWTPDKKNGSWPNLHEKGPLVPTRQPREWRPTGVCVSGASSTYFCISGTIMICNDKYRTWQEVWGRWSIWSEVDVLKCGSECVERDGLSVRYMSQLSILFFFCVFFLLHWGNIIVFLSSLSHKAAQVWSAIANASDPFHACYSDYSWDFKIAETKTQLTVFLDVGFWEGKRGKEMNSELGEICEGSKTLCGKLMHLLERLYPSSSQTWHLMCNFPHYTYSTYKTFHKTFHKTISWLKPLC